MERKVLLKRIFAIALAFVIAVIPVSASNVSAAKRPELNKKRVVIRVGKTLKLQVKNAQR